jgi:serine/threonine protein kinase/Flp pilus assembly protein TadD
MTDQDNDKTQAHTILAQGTMVSHYRIIEKIGAGGMGEVYLADDTGLNRRVALKFLPVHLAQNPDLRARFTREARAAAKLDHPNIITIHEVDEFDGRPFFVMQYIEGNTLHHYCHEETPSLDRSIALIAEVAAGLSKAHAAGIIHRDIKASNIIVDHEFRPKILDFGLAAIQDSEMLTKTGSTLGTISYMSPEQAQGREVDHRSDLFSLGIVLYELIAGRTPFRRNNDAATLQAIINESPEPLARYKSDVSPELQRLMDKILAKDPSERYQSAADFAADLRTVGRSADSGITGTSGRIAEGQPSIAVLPFANMSADSENEYFSDGLTEELLNVLAKNPELKVTGRTSSFAFKGKQEDLRVIGKKLGVGTLLEGSVRKVGNRVRITAQLVSVGDGFHLWSETYDRVLDDIFAVQDDIARSVSEALHVTLVGVDEAKSAVDPESYSLALRARQSWQQMNKESLSLAVELYRRAVQLDPQNAQAWAGLSLAYTVRIAYGHANYDDEYMPAREAAEKALALDDQLPAAYNAMSWVFAALELRILEGLPYIQRAYELAPNDSGIVSGISTWELILGNFHRAIDLSRKSLELDPLNPYAYRELGRIFYFSGNLDEGLRTYERALEMSPDMTSVYLGISGIKVLMGEFEEALKAAGKEKLAGYRLCGQAVASYALGRQSDSDQQLKGLIAEGEKWGFQVALVHAYRGESDKAFEWLERSYELHDAGIPLTKVNPFLKSLHSDPRWPVFLEKIGLAD